MSNRSDGSSSAMNKRWHATLLRYADIAHTLHHLLPFAKRTASPNRSLILLL